MRALLNLIFITLFLQITHAQQFPIDGMYQYITPPATPAMPDYGQSVVDNSVPTPIRITRVTESHDYIDNDGVPQVWYPTHEYSKTQVWNSDQTKYKISSWKVYDASTYQEIHSLSSMYSSYWSNTNPDLIWSFRENGDIKKHIVSTNDTQIVATLNKPGGGSYESVKLGPGEGNIDNNDHYVALVGKNGVDLDIIIFDLQTLTVATTENLPGAWGNGDVYAPDYIDWVSISQSGDYVIIMWNPYTTTETDPFNGHYGVEVYDRANLQFQHRIVSEERHGDLGYAQDGSEVLVQFWVGSSTDGNLYMHKLDGSGSTVVSTVGDFGVGHISCRNINRPGWAYVTNSLNAQHAQIVAVKLDNSGIVEHFGHHFSSSNSYEQAPMAVASPNGDLVCFKSDFGTAPGNGYVTYDFFASLANPLTINKEDIVNTMIYPNPVKDFIQINSKNTIKNVLIYNEIGQVVSSIENNNLNATNIDMKDLKKGVYFIRIITEKETITRKIIKY